MRAPVLVIGRDDVLAPDGVEEEGAKGEAAPAWERTPRAEEAGRGASKPVPAPLLLPVDETEHFFRRSRDIESTSIF